MKGTLNSVQKPVARKSRFFTPSEADRSLVLVRRIVEDIINSHARLLEWQESFENAQGHGHRHQAEEARVKLIDAADKIRSCLEELAAIGVEVKDWALGIVDFPARHDGREVRLCWRWGEPKVAFWHEVNEGFSGRKSVEMLLTAAV